MAGRKRKYDRKAMAEAFEAYIAATPIPIIAEFAAEQGMGKDIMYDWPAPFPNLLKRCTTKKEGALERAALTGGANVTMAIFSLKQLGWSDRQETTHKGDPNAPVQLILQGSDVHG